MASEYTTDTIEVLTGLAAVRKRPGLYVGSLDDGMGPLKLLLAVVAYAIDPRQLGRCPCIDVRVDADDFVTVADDGPGIPAGALVDLLERPAVGSSAHFGLRESGLLMANALSDPFEVDTVHAGEQATVAYAGGVPRVPLRVSAGSRPSGTRIRFRPDPQIFPSTRVPRVELTQRLEDLALLLPAMTLTWSFAGERATGLVERVRVEARGPLENFAHHQGEYATDAGPTTVEVALAWRTEPYGRPPQLLGFTNLERDEDGPHLPGLLAAVRDFLNLRNDRGHEGLVAAVSVLHDDALYPIHTKERLIHSPLLSAVKEATATALRRWAEQFPAAADALRSRMKPRRTPRR
jgi:DNA gyrase subunit B